MFTAITRVCFLGAELSGAMVRQCMRSCKLYEAIPILTGAVRHLNLTIEEHYKQLVPPRVSESTIREM